jgi:hypothetical protein
MHALLPAEAWRARQIRSHEEHAAPRAGLRVARPVGACFTAREELMQKLLLISVLIADVVIPLWASRQPAGRVALKRAVIGVILFNVVYLGAVLVLYPRL